MSILEWLFEAQIQFGSKSISYREIIGGLLGLSSAIFGLKRKVLAWPVGITGDALLFTVFLGAVFSFGADGDEKTFYGQAGRNLLLISLGQTGTWLAVDTWIFTGTALATFGMSRGYVEFWLVWVAVDLVGVPFAFSNGYYPTGTLYAIYLPFVIWGFISWLKISKKEKATV